MKFFTDMTGFDPVAKLGLASGSAGFLYSFLMIDVIGNMSYILGAIPLILGGAGAYYSFLTKKKESQKIEHETRTAEIQMLIAEAKLKEMQDDKSKDNKQDSK